MLMLFVLEINIDSLLMLLNRSISLKSVDLVESSPVYDLFT